MQHKEMANKCSNSNSNGTKINANLMDFYMHQMSEREHEQKKEEV